MQEPQSSRKIKKTYSFVNLVFGTTIFLSLQAFYDMLLSHCRSCRYLRGRIQIVDLPTERNYTFKSGVNIMFGQQLLRATVCYV